MTLPIAFINHYSEKNRERWLQSLRQALPEQLILPLQTLSPEQREQVQIAIVANPNVADSDSLPNLLWVHSLWAGVEQILPVTHARNVPLVRMQDPKMAANMAQAVLTWVLYLHRDMPAYLRQQQQQRWKQHYLTDAKDRRIGILGLGNMGMSAAEALKQQGFDVIGWSRRQKHLDTIPCYSGEQGLEAMLQLTDILLILLPQTPDTQGLMNAKRLALLPKGAQLINFARGPIVEEQALLDALNNEHLKHAVLDVFDVEPLPETHPYWLHPNVTVLPHITAPTDRHTAAQIVADNIRCYLDSGVLPETVSAGLGY